MARRCFIRAKNGKEWQEIMPADIANIQATFQGEPDDHLHARMAQRFGLEGDFEIEVRDYPFTDSDIHEVVRRVKGTTAVLTTDA